jgi:hypothetical protein
LAGLFLKRNPLFREAFLGCGKCRLSAVNEIGPAALVGVILMDKSYSNGSVNNLCRSCPCKGFNRFFLIWGSDEFNWNFQFQEIGNSANT